MIERFHVALGRIVSWLILAMVLIGSFNAMARYLGRFVGVNLSSNGLLEAQWYLFGVVFLLAAPYTLACDRHVRVDVLYSRLGPRHRAAIDIAGTVLFLLPFCIVGVVLSIPSVSNSIAIGEMSADPGGLPRYPIKTVIPAAFFLLGLQGLGQLPTLLRNARPESE